jgi:DNA-binding SARP family transcriptional activator
MQYLGADKNRLWVGHVLKALQVYLLGNFRIYADHQDLTALDGRRAQELFCYLLFHRNRSQSREHIASLLWNSEPDSRARSYLRKALWQLQGAIGNAHGTADEAKMLKTDSESIKLTPTENLWLDIDFFEKAYESVKDISGRDLEVGQVQSLERAERLYEGEVLDGWDQDWCLCERERFHYMYLAIMDKLLDYCETTQTYERGIEYALRILQFDRVHERTYQKLMRLRFLAGDRTSALREYEHCAQVLIDELGVQPSQQTKTLYQQVLDGSLADKGFSRAKAQETVPNFDLSQVLDRLREVQAAMGELQGKVEREISALEGVLTQLRT